MYTGLDLLALVQHRDRHVDHLVIVRKVISLRRHGDAPNLVLDDRRRRPSGIAGEAMSELG